MPDLATLPVSTYPGVAERPVELGARGPVTETTELRFSQI